MTLGDYFGEKIKIFYQKICIPIISLINIKNYFNLIK